MNGGDLVEDGNTAVDSNSDKNSKSRNGDIVNGDAIDDEGGGGGKDVEEEAVSMES